MADRSKTPTQKEFGTNPKPTPPTPPTPADDVLTTVWDKPPQAPVVPEPPPAAQTMRAISKKTPGIGVGDTPPRALPRVKLRVLSEVQSGPHAAPQALGNLAPPRDPQQARARRRNDLVLWGAVCIMIACAIAIAIWFLGR